MVVRPLLRQRAIEGGGQTSGMKGGPLSPTAAMPSHLCANSGHDPFRPVAPLM